MWMHQKIVLGSRFISMVSYSLDIDSDTVLYLIHPLTIGSSGICWRQ